MTQQQINKQFRFTKLASSGNQQQPASNDQPMLCEKMNNYAKANAETNCSIGESRTNNRYKGSYSVHPRVDKATGADGRLLRSPLESIQDWVCELLLHGCLSPYQQSSTK